MIESIKHFFSLIFDGSKSWTTRAATAISVLGVLIVTDILIDFSFNIQTKNRLEQLEKIQTLKSAYKNDSIKLRTIIDLENEIINKHHYSRNFLIALENTFKRTDKTEYPKTNIQKENKTKTSSIRSIYLMVITSSLSLVILWFVLFFSILTDKKMRSGNGLIGWFAGLTILSIFIAVITYLSYLIPLILNNPIWNYVLNIVLHIGLIFIIVGIDAYNKRNK